MRNTPSCAICLVALLSWRAGPVEAEPLEAGPITTSTTWSGTVRVGGDVTIAPGATLTLARGTRVLFMANRDDAAGGSDRTRSELIVEEGGALVAGAGGILFGPSNAAPAAPGWYGIRVLNGGRADLARARLRDGVRCVENAGALKLANTRFSDCGLIAGVDSVSYAETRTDSVATFTAADPATARRLVAGPWSVAGPDAGVFSLAGGAGEATLGFERRPDYEQPSDRGGANLYEVRVEARDRPRFRASKRVVVRVTDADEAGRVVLSSLRPQVGRELKALVHDPDGVANLRWRWLAVSTKKGAPLADTLSGESKMTPGAPVLGQRLFARASYDDRHGAGKQAVSDTTAATLGRDETPGRKEVMRAGRRIAGKLYNGARWGALSGAGLATGLALPVVLGDDDQDGFGAAVALIAGMAVGAVGGTAVGVSRADPRDRFILTLTGSLAGGATGIGLHDASSDNDWMLFVCPLIGATLASELWRKPAEDLRVSLGLAPDRVGRLSFVARLRF